MSFTPKKTFQNQCGSSEWGNPIIPPCFCRNVCKSGTGKQFTSFSYFRWYRLPRSNDACNIQICACIFSSNICREVLLLTKGITDRSATFYISNPSEAYDDSSLINWSSIYGSLRTISSNFPAIASYFLEGFALCHVLCLLSCLSSQEQRAGRMCGSPLLPDPGKLNSLALKWREASGDADDSILIKDAASHSICHSDEYFFNSSFLMWNLLLSNEIVWEKYGLTFVCNKFSIYYGQSFQIWMLRKNDEWLVIVQRFFLLFFCKQRRKKTSMSLSVFDSVLDRGHWQCDPKSTFSGSKPHRIKWGLLPSRPSLLQLLYQTIHI